MQMASVFSHDFTAIISVSLRLFWVR